MSPRLFHQEALLRKALTERGHVDPAIHINHVAGMASVDGEEMDIIYPDSFFDAGRTLFEKYMGYKRNQYFFQGITASKGKRHEMLDAFVRTHSTTIIVHSDSGRAPENKGNWDNDYYTRLARAMFGLCPHHLNFPDKGYGLWTYRFIECCMVGAIPVLFRETPLRESFVEGFHYVWNDKRKHKFNPVYAAHNLVLVQERFGLPQ